MTFNPTQPRENDGRFGSVHRGDPGQLADLADEPLDERERYVLAVSALFDDDIDVYGALTRGEAEAHARADYDSGTRQFWDAYLVAEMERRNPVFSSLPVARSWTDERDGIDRAVGNSLGPEYVESRTFATGRADFPYVTVEQTQCVVPVIDGEQAEFGAYEDADHENREWSAKFEAAARAGDAELLGTLQGSQPPKPTYRAVAHTLTTWHTDRDDPATYLAFTESDRDLAETDSMDEAESVASFGSDWAGVHPEHEEPSLHVSP